MANNNVPTFPYAAPNDRALTVATDNAETTLAADIGSGDTSIPVADASGFEVPCLLVIDGEIIKANDKSTNTFTDCERGYDGSSAASHTDTTQVFGYILAHHHNQVSAEIKSVGSYLFNSDFSGFKKNENLLTYSEAFNQGYWAKVSGVTISSDVDTLINGAPAFKLTEGASSGLNMISGLPSSLVVGDMYTFSVYVKYDSSQFMLIGQNLAGTEERWAWFDVQNGVLGTVGDEANAAIVAVGDGWFRCLIATTCTNDATKTFSIALTPSDGTKTYLGTSTNFNLISGAQVRSGGFDEPLTYIKTSGAAFSLTSSGDLILDEGDLS